MLFQDNINLYIPMAIGQTIPIDVINTINNQTIKTNIIECYSEGIIKPNMRFNSTIDQHAQKVKFECNSRNLAILKSQDDINKYCAMQDRDIVHLYNDNFSRCIEFLDINLDYAGVCLRWSDQKPTPHIRITAFVIRTEIFKKLQFRYDHRYHTCQTFKEDVLNYGKWEYFPSDKKLIEEII